MRKKLLLLFISFGLTRPIPATMRAGKRRRIHNCAPKLRR
jgi:hypothetical protein